MIAPAQIQSIFESLLPMLHEAFTRREAQVPVDCIRVKGDKLAEFLKACPDVSKPIALVVDADENYVMHVVQLKFLATPEPDYGLVKPLA